MTHRPIGDEYVVRLPDFSKRRRRVAYLLLPALAIFALGAASKTVVDAVRWRDQAPQARAVLADRNAGEREQREAIVVLQRDALRTIASLRRVAAADGPNAADARNALHWVIEATK